MNIRVVGAGRIKEPWLAAGAQEYRKRLRPHAAVELVAVQDEPLPPRGDAAERAIRRREGERILRHVPPGWRLVALDVGGKMLSSEELAGWLAGEALRGHGDFAFAIGGTLGLDEEVLGRADLQLSLSRLTFPHQMVPLLLLEQLYRACKINAGEPYHR